MKVLMISLDKGLLGQGQLGDVIERHKKYGDQVERLDIIVFSGPEYDTNIISDHVTAYPTKSNSKASFAQDARRIAHELFQKSKYDLIVTQEPFLTGWVGFRLKRHHHAKLLIHFHGDFWENPNWLKESPINPMLLLASKFTVKQADHIRVMSQGQKEKLLKAGIDETKVTVISTPVDIGKFADQESGIRNQESGRVVLHVGRDDKVKDYDTLVRVFRIIKERNPLVALVQIGSKVLLEEAKISNHFTNFIMQERKGHEDVISWIKTSTILISTSRSESFGKVLVEANAAGKPVVATATTGAKEIIQDGCNGFLVPIGDAQALADKVIELLNDPEKARHMGENGRKLVQGKYGDSTERIIALWKKIVQA